MPKKFVKKMVIKSKSKILILIGVGKTTLSKFMMQFADFDRIKVYEGYEEKDAAYIKTDAEEEGICSIIHLQDESQLKDISVGIKRRAIVFRIAPL